MNAIEFRARSCRGKRKLCTQNQPAKRKKKLDVWRASGVFEPLEAGEFGKAAPDARSSPARKMVEAARTVKTRLAAKGFRGPDLKDSFANSSGCVSLCSSQLQVISLSAPEKWKFRRLDIKNAILQAAGLSRDVILRAPTEWEP